MLWFLVPGIVAFGALAVIAGVLHRALPRLAVIDVATIVREREADRKRQIVTARAERLRAAFFAKVRARARPLIRAAHERFRVWYAQAAELERRYRHVGKTSSASFGVQGRAGAFVAEGKALIEQGKPREAEQKFIEAVNANPKETKAYEELGRLYVRERQWTEAEEAFRFLLKMDPDDASAHANLGELRTAQGKPAEAIPHFEGAVAIKPANPRLIALLLGAAIDARDKELALKTFARLTETAPQFPGIADFEERIRRM